MELKQIGVTPAKEKQFNKKGIYSVEDLVQYLPIRYNDFTKITGILPSDQTSCLILRLKSFKSYQRSSMLIMAFCVEEKTGARVNLQWFNQRWIAQKLSYLEGKNVFVAGKVTYSPQYDSYSMVPDIFEPDISKGPAVYPVYSKVPGMSNDYLTSHLKEALFVPEATEEILPQDVLDEEKQISMRDAINQLHFPVSMQQVERGRDRILFNDLLYFALRCENNKRQVSLGSQYNIKSIGLLNRIVKALPFELTDDQKNAVNSIVQDGKNGRRVDALLQGDVGCGKTIVAMLTIAAMVGSGYQAVLMAPTQVLARQHYEDAVKLFKNFDINVAFVGGQKMKKAEKTALLAGIADGSTQVVIGTHAVFSKDVHFTKLALTVVDEEHKFGVEQREALMQKAAEGVHHITMSATPIPRSLALVIYGDSKQLYTIRTMPNGRKPVITGIGTSRDKIYKFIIKQKKQGRQAYVVCPMIEQNDDMDGVHSVEEISAEYEKALSPYGIVCATLTGKNTQEETEDTIQRYKNGEIDVLIATTVIEVGVNVPNATLMVITNAERFGLSGLHQLRGRVGRGNLQSYCVLESDATSGDAKERLDAMCSTTDGFKIAEEDLRIRGAGDFLGTKQSGENKYMSLIMAYPQRFEKAKAIATKLLDRGDTCALVQQVSGLTKTY